MSSPCTGNSWREKSAGKLDLEFYCTTRGQSVNVCKLARWRIFFCFSRLSLSPRVTFRLDQEGTPTGSRRTPIRSGLKRKRTNIEELDDSMIYETKQDVVGDIEILEDDPEGKFIKLRNKGDKVSYFDSAIISHAMPSV